MNVPREQIATALLTLLQGVNQNISYGPAQFQLISRKGAIWSQTPPANQPALYIIQTGEHATQGNSFGATKWVLDFTLQIYAIADGSGDPVPDTLINAILDGIEATIQGVVPGSAWRKGQPQTLGGIVTNCWIEGEIIIGTGQLDTQLLMLVPVRVVTGI